MYSTDPAFRPGAETGGAAQTPSPNTQKIRIRLEKRNGKPTTVIDGYVATDADFDTLAKKLKTKAGTGGSAKDGLIIIQGDVKEKCIAWLKEMGFKDTK